MLNHDKIRRSMRAILFAGEGMPEAESGQYAWENRTFTPPNPANLWIEELYFPGQERQIASDQIFMAGVMQYNLCWPQGLGTETPERLAAVIENQFQPGTTISKSAPQIATMRAARKAGFISTRHDQAWYVLPVSITINVWDLKS